MKKFKQIYKTFEINVRERKQCEQVTDFVANLLKLESLEREEEKEKNQWRSGPQKTFFFVNWYTIAI